MDSLIKKERNKIEYHQYLKNSQNPTEIEKNKKYLLHDLEKLQKQLKILLSNVFVKDIIEQSNTYFNIADTTSNNIYNINPKISDTLQLDIDKYIIFLQFMIKELEKNNTDFENNTGDILTAHYLDGINKEDIDEINKIKDKYEDIYKLSQLTEYNTEDKKQNINERLSKLTLSKKSEDLSKKRHITRYNKKAYPNWIEDLLSVSKTSLYELIEGNINIPNILDQNDSQFIETLKERVKGLDICYKNENNSDTYNSYLKKEYYDYEFNSETQKIIDTESIPDKDKISEICNNIKWGTEDYKYYADKSDDDKLKDFIHFLANKPTELQNLKTFLPSKCFHSSGKINSEEILELIKTKDRKYRQYIFGFYNDIKDFIPVKQFYEIFNMQEGWNKNCHLLVNWNLIANMMYSRCSISNNTSDNMFPARFILPSSSRSKVKNNNSDKSYYDIRNPSNLKSIIFSLKSKLIFIGFINIKYFYEKTKQFRNWIMLIFKNLDNLNPKLMDYITGEIPKYIIVNFKFEQVNIGSLLGKIGATYEELKDFKTKSEDKTKHEKGKIFLYNFIGNKNTFFIRQKKLLEYEKNIFNMEEYSILYKPSQSNNRSYFDIANGGGNIEKYKINFKLLNNIDLFNDKLSNNIYKKYLNLRLSKFISNIKNEQNFEIFKVLYKYLCISSNELIYRTLINKHYYNKYLITQYKPLHYKYYTLYETLIKFDIFNNINKNDNILNIGTNLTPIEIIKNNNYKINKIKCIIFKPKIQYLKGESKDILNYIENFKKIYKLDIEFFTSKIENILDIDIQNINNYKLFFYSIYYIDDQFWMYNDFYNTINLFIGILLCVKYTKIGGYFIINLGNVSYKQTADIYLILKQYFKTSNLYYPEISNLYKDTGVLGVFQNFTGISNIEYNNLLEILNKLINKYPDNLLSNFNIYDKEQREKFNITKPIDETKRESYITGFLPANTDYSEIIKFNNSIYLDKLLFLEKVIDRYNNPINVKVPTQEQLTNAILYCKKYDIPYIDKFSNHAFKDKFGKQILHEAYGLHEPILYKFKTPFKLHIQSAQKSLKLISNISKSINKSISKSISKSINTRKTKKSNTKKNFGSFNMSDFFSKSSISKSISKTRKNTNRKHNKQHNKQHYKLSSKHYTEFTTNLIPELEFSNNRIEQTTKLIDSRRDFDAPEEKMQNLKWFEANKQFRYYKHKDDKEKIHLDVLVRDKLKDNSISQAWLKMYEIITDCNIVPTGRKGTFKSFHICEAPGTFINCLNNYIHTKTKYDNFEWKAQSLCDNNRNCGGKGGKDGTAFGDDFGLIRRHKDRWNWGSDETGNITHINNIQHYAKLVKDMNESGQPIDLMTSDCGLPMKSTGYEKVAFASFLAILHILPKGGTMVYKILSPIDEPIIYNLIYIAYTNFKDLIFYKPVQNSQSREFYIIGKGYLGTEPAILDRFFDVLKHFKEGQEIDLFGDEYPEAFVRQMVQASTELADNFVYTIERQIYFVDNEEMITPDFIKLLKTYYDEKNKDWIDKYKPMRLENYKDKL